ncbi:MAG TPA: TIR domain-containing protein [Thermoanaerobaculia bacterium]|nr:TIR domain-containing protein [Thermoanaerobaculia bacterium]
MPRYDVFLSHASADKPAVERLARKLRDEKLEPFLDKWHLVPGEPWQEGMEDALRESRTCAVFIGKKLGPWQNEEMRTALAKRVKNRSYRVIPVLLPGGPEAGLDDLSEFLGRLTWVDFRGGLDDEDALLRLLAGIRGEAPGPGGGRNKAAYRCMAPAREPFIQRSEYAKVRHALLLDEAGRATTVGITTAIHGAGGFGKTALAIELCYDEQLRERYPDGILWTTLGEEIDTAGRLARVRDLIRWWTEEDPPAFETVSAASAHLRQELHGKRVLLVVDDVWRPEDVTPFQGLAPLLVTTRDSRTLPLDAVKVHVDAMEVPEAVRLLGAGLPAGAEAELKTLAARLGEWPLLLKIVNRQLRDLVQKDGLAPDQALREVVEALDAEGLTVFDREDLESRGQAVARTVGASLRRLAGEDVSRFEQLAIFPEDKDIPLQVLEKLWGSGSFATKKLCGQFHDLSLLLRFDRQAGTIRLHDVIRAYLLKKGESRLPAWHGRLLDACRPANGRWPDLPREESYFWNHLIHHLLGAEQSDVCRSLLLDFHYLRSKLSATDVNALLADYSPLAENDEELRLVRDALRLSAHVLARNPAELREQLWGRLLDRRETGIRGLRQASEGAGAPWIRPRRASLTNPGGALIRTIDHLASEPLALAVLPAGRVVSGSSDGTLRMWDVESGKTLQTLEGHSAEVHAVAVLDSRRVVSGSADGTMRVWDVESGQTLQTLQGHSDRVRAVAVLDSRRVVSGSSDETLRVWDVESGQSLQTLEGHSSGVAAVAVLDSRRVVSSSWDLTLRVWDVESGQSLQTLEGHSSGVAAVAVLDSRRVVSSSWGLTLRVWDVESGQTLQTLKGHSTWVNAVAVLDSRRVVSGSDDRTMRVWDVESGQTLQTLKGHSDGVNAVAVLGSRRVISSSRDGTLRVWDVESSQALQTLEGHSARVNTVAVLDSHRVASGSDDGTLRVWAVESGQALQTLEGHSTWGNAVAVLDSRRVVSGSGDGTLRVWDLESGQTLQTLEGDPYGVGYGVHALAVLNSRRVVSSVYSWMLQVWDVENGQTLQTLEGHSHVVRALAVLDSGRVVSGSGDSTLRVWDVESGQTLQILEGHSHSVRALAVLDSRRVVSGSDDRTLRVWNVESGEVECLFTLDAPVTAVAVSPDRRLVVAGDQSGRVHFFDLVEGGDGATQRGISRSDL